MSRQLSFLTIPWEEQRGVKKAAPISGPLFARQELRRFMEEPKPAPKKRAPEVPPLLVGGCPGCGHEMHDAECPEHAVRSTGLCRCPARDGKVPAP